MKRGKTNVLCCQAEPPSIGDIHSMEHMEGTLSSCFRQQGCHNMQQLSFPIKQDVRFTYLIAALLFGVFIICELCFSFSFTSYHLQPGKLCKLYFVSYWMNRQSTCHYLLKREKKKSIAYLIESIDSHNQWQSHSSFKSLMFATYYCKSKFQSITN